MGVLSRRIARMSLLLVLISSVSACFSFGGRDKEAQTIEPIYYVIEANRGAIASNTTKDRVLLIKPVRVAPYFRSNTLMFRQGESDYQAQLGHQLVMNPQKLFMGQLHRWLSQSGLFTKVVLDDSEPADFVLESAVTALYGDARQAYPPSAVLEMQFFLTPTNPESAQVDFQTGLRIEADIDVTDASSVVIGWKNGLEEVLATLELDLNAYFSKLGTP